MCESKELPMPTTTIEWLYVALDEATTTAEETDNWDDVVCLQDEIDMLEAHG